MVSPFLQAEGCCSETRGDTPAYKPATEKPWKQAFFYAPREAGRDAA
jgi:hypothetical protein